MTDKLNDEQKARILTAVPAGRMGDAGGDRGGGAVSGQRRRPAT